MMIHVFLNTEQNGSESFRVRLAEKSLTEGKANYVTYEIILKFQG